MKKIPTQKLAISLLSAGVIFGTGGLFRVPTVVRAQTTPPTTYDEAAVRKGLEIAPVTLDFTGRDRNQVGYGSYLVNAVGGCNDCHTNPSFTAEGDVPNRCLKTL